MSPLDPVYKASHCAPSDMYRNGLTDLADWIPQNIENGLLKEGVDYFLNLFEVKRYWKDNIEVKVKEQEKEKDMVRESSIETDKDNERASKVQYDRTIRQKSAAVAGGEEEVEWEERESADSGVPAGSFPSICDIEGKSRAPLPSLPLLHLPFYPLDIQTLAPSITGCSIYNLTLTITIIVAY